MMHKLGPASRAARARPYDDFVSAAVLALGLAEPWEQDPRLFDPLFLRYEITPSDAPATLKRLIYAMARKHENGFKHKRGRPPARESTDAAWRDMLFYCYLRNFMRGKNCDNANWACGQINGKPAFKRFKGSALRNKFNRGKKEFERRNPDVSTTLKEIRVSSIAEMYSQKVLA